MRSTGVLYVFGLLTNGARADFDGNLNYASPSKRHTRLGVDVPLVERRSWKRGNVAYKPSDLAFTHGVASGDPWSDSVILWTRIAPSDDSSESTVVVDGTAKLYDHETEKYIKADPNPICVEWNVYESLPQGRKDKAVANGMAYTTSDIDYTVKVQVTKFQCQDPI
jgi:alkaline phosphatase D